MTKPAAARAFLIAEVEELAPFGFIAVVPDGHPLHALEVARREDGELELRVPGRPPVVPALDAKVRSALQARDFKAEDPEDSSNPWVRAMPDAKAAVELLQELLVEVLGEKPDAALDVHHGSYELQHEAQQKLARTRTRIESIVTDILERPPEKDADDDYVLPIGEVHVMVAPRATQGTQGAQIVTRIFAITNVGVGVTPELGLFLARLNFGLMFGSFALDAEHRAIYFDETLIGEHFREEELRFAVRIVAATADEWDDRLQQMFGGSTYQEVLKGQADDGTPPGKPGEGVGQYL